MWSRLAFQIFGLIETTALAQIKTNLPIPFPLPSLSRTCSLSLSPQSVDEWPTRKMPRIPGYNIIQYHPMVTPASNNNRLALWGLRSRWIAPRSVSDNGNISCRQAPVGNTCSRPRSFQSVRFSWDLGERCPEDPCVVGLLLLLLTL